MHRRVCVAMVAVLLGAALTSGQQPDAASPVARIRTEGLQRSRALALYRTLTDEIGARLTGSPAHLEAARWARDRFAEWGLANTHLEP
jgi:carboxypeptidase Q